MIIDRITIHLQHQSSFFSFAIFNFFDDIVLISRPKALPSTVVSSETELIPTMGSMNNFRLCGDLINMMSFLAVMVRFLTSRNAQAISLRSLEILLLVCLCRYVDIFTSFYSLYNSVLKVVYIAISLTAVLKIRFYEPLRSTYDESMDSFPHWKVIVIPSFAFAAVFSVLDRGLRAHLDVMEFLWRVSIILEAFQLVPQLYLLRNYEDIECLTGSYIFGKSIYRMFYILNWIYRAQIGPHNLIHPMLNVLVYVCGVIQSLIGAYAVHQLRDKKWEPSGLLARTTYSQPRVSRLLEQPEQEESDMVAEEEVDAVQDEEAVVQPVNQDAQTELSEPLLRTV
jgi:ER lumen protein retaining receptor